MKNKRNRVVDKVLTVEKMRRPRKADNSAHDHKQALSDIGIVALEPHELHGDLQYFKLIG